MDIRRALYLLNLTLLSYSEETVVWIQSLKMHIFKENKNVD